MLLVAQEQINDTNSYIPQNRKTPKKKETLRFLPVVSSSLVCVIRLWLCDLVKAG